MKISREEARQPKTHNERFSTSCNFITQYNLLLPNIKTIIKKHFYQFYTVTKTC